MRPSCHPRGGASCRDAAGLIQRDQILVEIYDQLVGQGVTFIRDGPPSHRSPDYTRGRRGPSATSDSSR
jgi:hypothetical protein